MPSMPSLFHHPQHPFTEDHMAGVDHSKFTDKLENTALDEKLSEQRHLWTEPMVRPKPLDPISSPRRAFSAPCSTSLGKSQSVFSFDAFPFTRAQSPCVQLVKPLHRAKDEEYPLFGDQMNHLMDILDEDLNSETLFSSCTTPEIHQSFNRNQTNGRQRSLVSIFSDETPSKTTVETCESLLRKSKSITRMENNQSSEENAVCLSPFGLSHPPRFRFAKAILHGPTPASASSSLVVRTWFESIQQRLPPIFDRLGHTVLSTGTPHCLIELRTLKCYGLEKWIIPTKEPEVVDGLESLGRILLAVLLPNAPTLGASKNYIDAKVAKLMIEFVVVEDLSLPNFEGHHVGCLLGNSAFAKFRCEISFVRRSFRIESCKVDVPFARSQPARNNLPKRIIESVTPTELPEAEVVLLKRQPKPPIETEPLEGDADVHSSDLFNPAIDLDGSACIADQSMEATQFEDSHSLSPSPVEYDSSCYQNIGSTMSNRSVTSLEATTRCTSPESLPDTLNRESTVMLKPCKASYSLLPTSQPQRKDPERRVTFQQSLQDSDLLADPQTSSKYQSCRSIPETKLVKSLKSPASVYKPLKSTATIFIPRSTSSSIAHTETQHNSQSTSPLSGATSPWIKSATTSREKSPTVAEVVAGKCRLKSAENEVSQRRAMKVLKSHRSKNPLEVERPDTQQPEPKITGPGLKGLKSMNSLPRNVGEYKPRSKSIAGAFHWI
ncbi:hypothetical protein NEOLI_000404 [Neolecta irregularis DAH-3]|uniref:Uncharacterized protein n=1 Tax=Neolecta irregularis (strain DAH-3) TaxID=1198029 RepID=A0A1U7LUI5_NEOID|nr:hypothetical protein NEOLI_000404 [Neolecta irregularis DAH-3]|eukprot:OLL26327.1 hypothetical protein NEOLI_000404 [Neolecta irregularis DAH-3]